MSKKLKLWNGRERYKGEEVTINVAAPSLAAAAKMVEEALECYCSVHYVRNYYSPCWGYDMDGITPERGVWIVNDKTGAVRRIL